MACCDLCEECETERTEAKEYAYFSGLSSATKRERERIVYKLEHMLFPSPIEALGLANSMLNFIAAKGDDLTAGDVAEFAQRVIDEIKGENK